MRPLSRRAKRIAAAVLVVIAVAGVVVLIRWPELRFDYHVRRAAQPCTDYESTTWDPPPCRHCQSSWALRQMDPEWARPRFLQLLRDSGEDASVRKVGLRAFGEDVARREPAAHARVEEVFEACTQVFLDGKAGPELRGTVAGSIGRVVGTWHIWSFDEPTWPGPSRSLSLRKLFRRSNTIFLDPEEAVAVREGAAEVSSAIAKFLRAELGPEIENLRPSLRKIALDRSQDLSLRFSAVSLLSLTREDMVGLHLSFLRDKGVRYGIKGEVFADVREIAGGNVDFGFGHPADHYWKDPKRAAKWADMIEAWFAEKKTKKQSE